MEGNQLSPLRFKGLRSGSRRKSVDGLVVSILDVEILGRSGLCVNLSTCCKLFIRNALSFCCLATSECLINALSPCNCFSGSFRAVSSPLWEARFREYGSVSVVCKLDLLYIISNLLLC